MNKKYILFIFLSLFTTHFCIAQEEDYVLEGKKSKNVFSKNSFEIKNPDYTSYFISPTAFTITKRDFRLASNDLIFFKGTYGLTSTTNISLNSSLFGTLIGSLKQSINLEEEKTLSFTASFGDFTASLKDTNILFMDVDANFTFGNHQNNFTIGTGVNYIKSNIDLVSTKNEIVIHTINFGFQNQISRKIYVMVDGYYFTNFNILAAAAGFKFVIKTRYTLNAGVMPILWNNIRSSRYDIKPMMMPVLSFRMLIERKDK